MITQSPDPINYYVKQFIELGDNLSKFENLAEQREIILQAASSLFSCKVDVFLLENPLNLAVSDQLLESIQFVGLTPLMSAAIRNKGILGASTPENYDLLDGKPLDPINEYRQVDSRTKYVAAPIQYEKTIFGALQICQASEAEFKMQDIPLLENFASQVALSLNTCRHISTGELQRKIRSVVQPINKAITDFTEIEQFYVKVTQILSEAPQTGYPFVNIYTVHPGRKGVFFEAGHSPSGPILVNDEFSISLEDESSEIVQAVHHKGIHEIEHLVNLEVYGQEIEIKSGVLVPLVYLDEVIGVLELLSEYSQNFTSRDRSFWDELAEYLTIAMRNANLFRSEKWRRHVAESMREVAGLLTANAATAQILKIILTELEKILPCDVAAVWLTEDAPDGMSSHLKLADIHLTHEYETNYGLQEGSLTSSEIQQILTQSEIPSPWLQDSLAASERRIRLPGDPYEPLGAILDFPSDYSAIAAPLCLKDEPFGVLVLSHHTSGRYGREAQTMTETFASYASVAIENTRLYESAHDQAWISTVLLQVSEATQAVSSLDELLTTLVRLTPILLGVNSCSVFLWDNSMDIFTPTASYGLQSIQSEEFYSHKIYLGEIPCFDRLLLTKEPVFVNQETAKSYFSTFDLESTVLILFPMISHNEVLGAFLIDYDLNPPHREDANISQKIDWEQKYSIIQGIAHQAAIAVENIRLVKSQQDEAYVSIALLQVAQAVVSLNELDDILETIVRITPILVGVKRSMIFFWNSDTNTFRLKNSYGVSRNDLSFLDQDFSPEEFPLLNTVRNSNSIVYIEIEEAVDSPLSWIDITNADFDFIEVENYSDPVAALSDTPMDDFIGKDHLRVNKRLLYGFPLSVKGVVLGVLLTQEREGPNDLPTRQVREKRLEISIGISQQAAMAIQNDVLQREVVERERLEREFQLARSIQQSFLPENLPHHDNWDLYSLWRPARQVSGDFYDVIPLRGGKWGLVIADVADKGMPAALYMTLIRTLIRASVRDEDTSPATVLRRVNDLLVADSKSGMFVTVVYGVLSINSCCLEYANAGHNPPLIIRGLSHRIQKLHGTGMALGIFEGIDIQQKTVRLKPGDSIVFYTDGITEAFSPQETMFGERRLMRIIRQSNASGARALAQTIDHSVMSFIEDGSPSDDITMLVLNRNK